MTLPYYDISIFNNVPQSTGTLYVPAESIEAYKNAYAWKEWGTILPIAEGNTIEDCTDISQYDIALYFNDVVNRAGDLNLELNMKCAEENITAFQCDIYLPEGVEWKYTTDKRGKIVYNLPTFNEDRTDDSYHTITPIAKNADGSYNIIVYSMDKEVILDTDGCLMTLPLTISEEMEAGEYNIFIKNITLTDVDKNQTLIEKMVSRLTIPSYQIGDANGDDIINVTDIVYVISNIRGEVSPEFIFAAADVNEDGIINVTDIVGIIDIIRGAGAAPTAKAIRKAAPRKSAPQRGNTLEVIPYTIEAGTKSSTVKLNLNNPGDEFTAFQCDIDFPEGISWSYTVDRRGNVKYNQPTFDAEADRTDATYHTVSAGVNTTDGSMNVVVYSMNKEVFLEEEGAILDLPFTYSESLAPGVYDITMKRIYLTRTDGSQCALDDYTFSVVVGSPDVPSVTLYGDYTQEAISELNTSLENNVAAIDLTNAVAVSADQAFDTGNPNLILYVNENTEVANEKNVVSSASCDNLVLTDGHNCCIPTPFTAQQASYSREMANAWGTVCLPMELTSDEAVQYYRLSEVNGTNLIFEPVASIEAGEPAVFKLLNGNKLNINVADATLSAGATEKAEAVDGWTMKGAYYAQIIVPVSTDTDIYYIAQNKFWYANQAFPAAAFRAWFETTAAAGAKAYRISEDTVDAVNYIEQADGKVEVIYDLGGRRQATPQRGINIINGKKIATK